MKPITHIISSVHRVFQKTHDTSKKTEIKASKHAEKDHLERVPHFAPTSTIHNKAELPIPYRANLMSAMEKIKSYPSGDLDLQDISECFATSNSDVEAKVWLGICRRLEGKDASVLLKPYIHHPQFGRLALVNLAATYACLPSPGARNRNWGGEIKACLTELRNHLTSFPNDRFARLLESFLTFRLYDRPEALRLVENLYLLDKNYAPAISTMAAYMHLSGLFVAARDFAEEALTIDQDNFQAQAILYTNNMPPFSPAIESKLKNIGFRVYAVDPISILFSKYSSIDTVI
jgi:hypothetical protein